MAGKDWTAGTQPAEQALQADTASGFSARHRPQQQTASSRPALQQKQQLPTMLAGHLLAVVLRPVPDGESAGCVRLQCLFCGLCACCPTFACHAHCPHQYLPRSSFALCVPLFIAMCARIGVRASSLQAARTVPLAAATRACSGGPCAGPFCDCFLFPAEFMILGHGLV